MDVHTWVLYHPLRQAKVHSLPQIMLEMCKLHLAYNVIYGLILCWHKLNLFVKLLQHIINWNNITYLSSGVMSKQNLLSIESEIRLTHDFNLNVSVDTIFAVVC